MLMSVKDTIGDVIRNLIKEGERKGEDIIHLNQIAHRIQKQNLQSLTLILILIYHHLISAVQVMTGGGEGKSILGETNTSVRRGRGIGGGTKGVESVIENQGANQEGCYLNVLTSSSMMLPWLNLVWVAENIKLCETF